MKRAAPTPPQLPVLDYKILAPTPTGGAHLPLRTVTRSMSRREQLYGVYLAQAVPLTANLLLCIQQQGAVIFCAPASGGAAPVETVELLDRRYVVYETHVLALERDDAQQRLHCVYVEVENVAFHTGEPVMQVRVDMGARYLPGILGAGRYRSGTTFFPPDVDPAQHRLRVDPVRIAQRTPLWFGLRGEVTGSKAARLLGFWVPTKEENPHWTIDTFDADNDEHREARMRFGAQSEETAAIVYLCHAPHVSLETVGTCHAPPNNHARVPVSWTASPDARVRDASMGAHRLKTHIAQHYTAEQIAALDPQRGVLEIKTTQDLDMKDYYYPQVYMEMLCADCLWSDLLCYRRSAYRDPLTQQWRYAYAGRCYRTYRHRPTAEFLVQMLKYAYSNRHRLQELVHTDERFIKMRAYFRELARTADVEEMQVTPEVEDIIAAYDRRRAELGTQRTMTTITTPTERVDNEAFRRDVSQRHGRIVREHDAERLALLLREQMDAQGEWLRRLSQSSSSSAPQ